MNSKPLPAYRLKDYNFAEKLGSGTYGIIYKAYKRSGAREVVAVKTVLKSKLSKAETDNLITEIRLLKTLKHPHVVEMYDFSWDVSYIYIIMEYCGRGDLSRFIKTRKSLPENIVRRFLQQLGMALKFLHSKSIAHMDLKPQNILLSHDRILKLADFGFAKVLTSKESSLRGSPLYMAPEIILNRRYDAKVDLWSVGVILYECLFGTAPYKSSTVEELLEKIKTDEPVSIPSSPSLSSNCRDILVRCLDRDPKSRIDFQDFFLHPFLDLEHAPSESNFRRGINLMESAIKADRDDSNPERVLNLYKDALEYIVPILRYENNAFRKQKLREKAEICVSRAEELKNIVCPDDSNEMKSEKNSSQSQKNFKLLIQSCASTPNLKIGLEILNDAEMYERDRNFIQAFDRYEAGLGIVIPILSKEPKGERRNLLRIEIERWMSRAEKIKDIVSVLDLKSVDESVSDKNCRLQ